MKIKLLKRARRHLRIIKREYDYELQYKNDTNWEYLYDGALSETLRIMHNHMRRNLQQFYVDANKPEVIC